MVRASEPGCGGRAPRRRALRRSWALAAWIWLIGCAAAGAAPLRLQLSPEIMRSQTHSHGLMMSFTGTYRQLSGTLDFDPQTGTCHIDVSFVVRSLSAPNALIERQTMSDAFLDPGDFPQTRYVGDCRGNLLVGLLTLRGQTHPFNMTLHYFGSGGQLAAVHAEGVLDRYAWGVDGLRLLIGKNIRITNDISLNGTSVQGLAARRD